jgi:hypothetical protein
LIALPVSQARSTEEKLRAYSDIKGAPPPEYRERLLAKLAHLEARELAERDISISGSSPAHVMASLSA